MILLFWGADIARIGIAAANTYNFNASIVLVWCPLARGHPFFSCIFSCKSIKSILGLGARATLDSLRPGDFLDDILRIGCDGVG